MTVADSLLNSCRKSIHFGFPKIFDFVSLWKSEEKWNFSSDIEILLRTNFSHHRPTVPAQELNGGCCVLLFTNKCAERMTCAQSNARSFISSFLHVVCFYKHTAYSSPTHSSCAFKFIHNFFSYDFNRITMSISNQSSDKREVFDDGLQDLGVPISVQTFLWGQIAPFIRPKLGKLHEAACQVRLHR